MIDTVSSLGPCLAQEVGISPAAQQDVAATRAQVILNQGLERRALLTPSDQRGPRRFNERVGELHPLHRGPEIGWNRNGSLCRKNPRQHRIRRQFGPHFRNLLEKCQDIEVLVLNP